MRIVAHHRHDSLDLAVLIKDNASFHRIEIDRTALVPGCAQDTVETVQSLEIRHPVLIYLRMTAVLQHLTHLGVSQTGVGVNDRLIEAVFGQHTLGTQFHLADHRQSVHCRLQRTQAVGQGLRQHRYHPRREIDRVAAQRRLLVEGRPRRDIVGDVGNRHPQAPAAAALFAVHRIIKIPGILTVDSDERQFA